MSRESRSLRTWDWIVSLSETSETPSLKSGNLGQQYIILHITLSIYRLGDQINHAVLLAMQLFRGSYSESVTSQPAPVSPKYTCTCSIVKDDLPTAAASQLQHSPEDACMLSVSLVNVGKRYMIVTYYAWRGRRCLHMLLKIPPTLKVVILWSLTLVWWLSILDIYSEIMVKFPPWILVSFRSVGCSYFEIKPTPTWPSWLTRDWLIENQTMHAGHMNHSCQVSEVSVSETRMSQRVSLNETNGLRESHWVRVLKMKSLRSLGEWEL